MHESERHRVILATAQARPVASVVDLVEITGASEATIRRDIAALHLRGVFCLTGLMAGVAAVLLTSRLASTRPSIAQGWELEVVTMVVLGGVNILGGAPSRGCCCPPSSSGLLLSVLGS